MRGFASDNYAGVHPDLLAAIAEANRDHAVAYGDDPWTARAGEAFRRHFGPAAQAFAVFNGSAANVLALSACCEPWEAVVCTSNAHIHVDEAGAPERVAGLKLLALPTPDGKLTPELALSAVERVGDQHAVQARVVSITQSSELGTRYSPTELRALADAVHDAGLLLHVDGARLANAAAGLGSGLGEACAGADVVSFGATKLGGLGTEAVVLLRPDLADGFAWRRKQLMQLASKARFAAAQFVALLEGDLWRRTAEHANAMAARLAAAVDGLPGVTLTQRVEANAVFAVLPPAAADRLRERFPFYSWNEATGEVRWMCAWDTTTGDVDAFAAALSHALARATA